jgi:hypothetical protein
VGAGLADLLHAEGYATDRGYLSNVEADWRLEGEVEAERLVELRQERRREGA